MKRIILTISLFALPGLLFAVPAVWRSSHTTTADTTQKLCNQTGSVRRGILHGVCVNTAVSGGSITVYNSSSTAVNAVAVLASTATLVSGCQFYDISMSSGIVYTTSQPNDTTFLYDCY